MVQTRAQATFQAGAGHPGPGGVRPPCRPAKKLKAGLPPRGAAAVPLPQSRPTAKTPLFQSWPTAKTWSWPPSGAVGSVTEATVRSGSSGMSVAQT